MEELRILTTSFSRLAKTIDTVIKCANSYLPHVKSIHIVMDRYDEVNQLKQPTVNKREMLAILHGRVLKSFNSDDTMESDFAQLFKKKGNPLPTKVGFSSVFFN